MREDACCKVADLHLWAVQQMPDVVQEPLHHQLSMQLPHLRYVVLQQEVRREKYFISGSIVIKHVVIVNSNEKAVHLPTNQEPSAE